MNSPILRTHFVTKSFGQEHKKTEILRGLNFEITAGEDVCIVGASGVGKSTFLNILGSLDEPTSGRVFFKDQPLNYKNDSKLAHFRNRSLGFVFQSHYLLTEFTALENVMLPCQIAGFSYEDSKEQAASYLKKLGMDHRMTHHPSELSGGEKQRVAIARAVVMGPEILMADEPTGNLDSENGKRVQELFFMLKDSLKLTLIVVTHDIEFAMNFSKIYKMKDGLWL